MITSSIVSIGVFMVASSSIEASQEVAAVAGFPLVVLLDENGSGKAQERGGVGEHADDVGAAFDLLVHPHNGFVDQICRQCLCGNDANARRSCWASSSMTATFGWERPSIVVTS